MMGVPEYPKIETLFDRDPVTFKVIPGRYRWPEFDNVRRWSVTEKIDGTNVRVALLPDGTVWCGGKTDQAQMPVFLFDYLRTTFPAERLRDVLWNTDIEHQRPTWVLYGEGYGPKIQKGGGRYRATPGFRLFDVMVGGLWLEPESIEDIADQLDITHAPVFGVRTLDTAIDLLNPGTGFDSRVAREDGGDPDLTAEGIVARSAPLLLSRRGERVMWKLKTRDF